LIRHDFLSIDWQNGKNTSQLHLYPVLALM
jgi:hypothetical protein